MSLCASCLGLRAASFPQVADPDMFKPGTRELSIASTKLRSTSDRGCESCFMILEAVKSCANDVSKSCESWDTDRPFAAQIRALEGDITTMEAVWDVKLPQFYGQRPKIELELYSESTESSPFTGFGVSKEILTKPDANVCANIFDSWVSDCREHHGGCRKPEKAILPKRVIDVKGYAEYDPVSVLETLNGQRDHYIALSHCWGSESFIQTTRASLKQRMSNISWSELPRTFQDAITFARKIKVEYIWIDSLCIIQDDTSDWESESAVMADIYSNAYITLAATGPAGYGCFFDRWINPSILNWNMKAPIHSHQITSRKDPNLKIHARLRLDGIFNSFTSGVTISILEDTAPLLSRAWIFQERFLSPRVLHFHAASLVWECHSALYLEPYGLEDFSIQRTTSDIPLRLKKVFAKLDFPETTSLLEAHDLWLSFVSEYSRLKLTYETDRLPALSGIATRFNQFFLAKGCSDNEYLAGVWRFDLIRSLIWGRNRGQTRHFPKPSPPTWSWASVERLEGSSQISFRHDHIHFGEISRKREFVPDPRLHVLDINCSLTGKNSFGHVSGGRLDIVGPVVDAIIFYQQNSPNAILLFQSDISEDWILVEKESIWQDVPLYDEKGPEFLSPGTSMLCLLVGSGNDFDNVVYFALVLKEMSPSNPGCYERVGLLVSKVGQSRAFLKMQETKISIF
ncbi:hypothetical protein EG329_004190 [Mollisiaceae sp. DMI_Dod_QoI]|nr:hypothetical protein EG329_004190 [Helotiales sp. DMI_Dod_QoI]